MKPKMIGKIGIDCVMTVLLVLLMGRQITGESAHEWLGAGIFVLWIAHHVLNRAWFAHLFQGRYTPYRAVQTGVNVLLLFSMLGTMVSAVILSREVFAFLPISGGIALGRITHIVCVFWMYVLMALHLGLHWNMILGMMRKRFGPVPLFFTEYIGIMGLFVFLAHYGGKGMQRMSGRRKEQKERA